MSNGTTTIDLDDQLGGTPDAGAWSITTDPSSGTVSIRLVQPEPQMAVSGKFYSALR